MRRTNLVGIAILGLSLGACKKDLDKDGFKGDDDCDDLNASIHPGADETCDGMDNNCNGKVDEGLILEWYADKDDDGYGDADTVVTACTTPAGYVDNADDCNDASDLYRPGAVETDCEDPEDYNCDGSTGYDDADLDGYAACMDCDDSDADTYAPTLWYIDYDGDSFGSTIYTDTACSQPAGYTDNADDCDDLVETINPDASETCNELDDNCDGSIDEEVTITYYADSDGDGYGDSSATVQACSTPDGFANTDDDCDDTLDMVNPGAEEICDDGLDNDCDGAGGQCTLDPADSDGVFWGMAPFDAAGVSVSGGGDFNGDGYDDIVIGAKHESSAAAQAGAAYVIYGGEDIGVEMDLAEADVVLTGVAGSDKAGRVVAVAEDVNDDGGADLLVGAPSADPSGDASGTAYILFGGGISGSLADADVTFTGRTGYNYAGLGLTSGDLDGDGEGDVLIGAPGNDVGGANTGTIYILWGPIESGSVTAASVSDYVTGQAEGDGIGDSMRLFDVNSDGVDDMIVGAPDNSEGGTDAGSVYVVLGPVTGAVGLDDADIQYVGESASDKFGISVASAGDVDGDGADDIIAGAAFDDTSGPDSGAAYIVTGGTSAVGGAVDEIATVKLTGTENEDQFGAHVDGNGDINDDGIDDFIVSAPFAGGTSDTGKVYVFYGAIDGSVSAEEADAWFEGDTLGDQLGNDISFVGDVDGDGNDAILIGAANDDSAGEDAGGAFLMLDIGL
ncbi:MAG: MopE-related protein [Myxococcota bacterium]